MYKSVRKTNNTFGNAKGHRQYPHHLNLGLSEEMYALWEEVRGLVANRAGFKPNNKQLLRAMLTMYLEHELSLTRKEPLA